MNQQRLLFEYSPAYLVLCFGAAIGYAWLLYKAKRPWSRTVNRLLFALRTAVVFGIAFLLIGPILKMTKNTVEKPAIVFLTDNSLSIKEGVDSAARIRMTAELKKLAEKLKARDMEVIFRDLTGTVTPSGNFNSPVSDLSGALRSVADDQEGRNLAGIVLTSDGIYNSGASPLYTSLRVPVFTVGVGDTSHRMDLVLKNLEFNKIAYQGNRFPLRVEVLADGYNNQDVSITVSRAGTVVGRQTRNAGTKMLMDFDFQLEAKDKGLQRIDVVVEPAAGERNLKNNRATAFVDVVEGKKKILLIAPAPHPDIKALRAVTEKNANYEFFVHLPGIREVDPALLLPGAADLVIFHQVLDSYGKTTALFSRLSKGPSSLLLIAGTGSNLRAFTAAQIPLNFERAGQWDEATPVINPAFRDFGFSDNSSSAFSKYPPVTVPFGKFSLPPDANVLLYQRIGSVETDRPLMMSIDTEGHKTGLLIGENIWRWRLNEFSETEKTEAFDEVFGKFIQYLTTRDDKRKFRVFPIQHEFTDAESVVFESQVYNDLFEQIYGTTIAIDLQNERGTTTHYNYVTSPGGTRYRIGGLAEGVYKYTGTAQIKGKREEIKGEFLVTAQNIESQQLTADFGLLRKLAEATGGKFRTIAGLDGLESDISRLNAKGRIHSEETFNPMINLPWVLLGLLLLISVEWFFRKFLGAY